MSQRQLHFYPSSALKSDSAQHQQVLDYVDGFPIIQSPTPIPVIRRPSISIPISKTQTVINDEDSSSSIDESSLTEIDLATPRGEDESIPVANNIQISSLTDSPESPTEKDPFKKAKLEFQEGEIDEIENLTNNSELQEVVAINPLGMTRLKKKNGKAKTEVKPQPQVKPQQSHYDLCVDEVIYVVGEMMEDVGNAMPENNYWAGSFYTIVFPFLLQEIKAILVLPQHPSVGPWWNYLDAICSIALGCVQITDNTSHRPDATTAKGILNLLSGLELSTLTFISFSAFGGPGFAAAFFACMVISMDETVRAYRRMKDPEYWMKDSIAELLKLEELEAKLLVDTGKLNSVRNENSKAIKDRITNWTYERQDNRLREYQGKIKRLRHDITVRAKMMLDPHEKGDPLPYLREYQEKTVSTSGFDFLALDLSVRDFPEEERIERKCKKQFRYCTEDTAAFFFAFAGVLLTCIPIPPVQIVGIACIGVAS
ncbi:MAG TPA: hypothetical protein VHM20_08475, partial [Gammaproteobacteria bacterium]|nr:hypothetical protein [Gammaproteobacteria bacterium]